MDKKGQNWQQYKLKHFYLVLLKGSESSVFGYMEKSETPDKLEGRASSRRGKKVKPGTSNSSKGSEVSLVICHLERLFGMSALF